VEFLVDAIKDLGLEKAKIGIELDYLPARDYSKLRALLPRATFEDAKAFFGNLRMIKTDEEIEKLRLVGRAAEKVHHDSFAKLEPGMVLCVEPYYMMVDQNMGFQIEDEIVVTENGYELITDYKDSSELIQIS
jgi:Xaa-Pro aminopeptidase